jgi:hypothetical protein
MQKAAQKFISPCGKCEIYVENDMPIGVFHDFLMLMKGTMVDKMVKIHKEQLEEQEMLKELEGYEGEENSCCSKESNCGEVCNSNEVCKKEGE